MFRFDTNILPGNLIKVETCNIIAETPFTVSTMKMKKRKNLINDSLMNFYYIIHSIYDMVFIIFEMLDIHMYIWKIKNYLFFSFPKKNIFYFIYHLIVSRKEPKIKICLKKITKQVRSYFKIYYFFVLIAFFIHYQKGQKQPTYIGKENYRLFPKAQTIRIETELEIDGKVCLIGLVCESENMTQGRSYQNMNVNISNCFFSRSIGCSGGGGVIYVSGGSYYLYIYYSMFYNCVCSQNGGALYFHSMESYLRMICANECSCGADYGGHFAYNVVTLVNHLEYLSVSYCSDILSGRYPLYLQSGNQRVDNTNSSMNNANQGSGIRLYSPSSFTSTHCTFSNNKVSSYICLFFYSVSGTMSFSNLVHNNSPSRGIVYSTGGSPKMEYCIFSNNQNHIFCVLSGSLEVSHSFIDHSSSSISSGLAVTTVMDNSLTMTFTYQIQFFNSLYCYTDITPIGQKQFITIDQTHLRSFFSLYQMIVLLMLD